MRTDISSQTVDALGIAIVDGARPGRSFFAAGLRNDVDAVNRRAQADPLGMMDRTNNTAHRPIGVAHGR